MMNKNKIKYILFIFWLICFAGMAPSFALAAENSAAATCTEEQVNNFCLKLPRYKRPRKIIFADVPRNPTGKIEKPKLREKYGATMLVAAENEL